MRAWVLIATSAAILCTKVYGSTDFGDKINSPVATDSPRSASAESSNDSSKERTVPESRQKERARQEHSNGSLDKLSKISTDVPKNVEKTADCSTPSPQEPFRQHLESPYNVNSLNNAGHDYNPLAALYEATRDAYVQSSRSNFYSNPAAPHFQHPNIPYNDAHLRPPPFNANSVATHALNQQIHSNHQQSPFHQHNNQNRYPHPFQNNKIQETTFVDIHNARGANYNNNFDDYDDGSYDPYKYGDYLYFENNDVDHYNQNYQTPLNVFPTPYQHSQPFHSKPSHQLSNNHYQQITVQPFQNVFQPPNVQQQVHSAPHKQQNNVPSYSKGASTSLNDNYSYQVEAATRYLKEIEEAQEYAKKVLAANNPPADPRQSSQPASVQTDYYDYQNQHASFTNNEGRYNNYPLESSHYQQTARPSQQVEVNSGKARVNQETNRVHGGNIVEDAPISSSHEKIPRRKPSVSPVPTIVPVLLPNGFLADTEEVRLAKIAHLQLVLDTLKTVSTYKRRHPTHKSVNAL